MRTEQEMFRLIIDAAKSDERVLAAYLKGSRANPNITKDIYQDYDIMYVVKETESFRNDVSWMNIFGEIYIQKPTEIRFRACCNEFFWSLTDVVKGILRDELPFAMFTYQTQAHQMLETMLGWYIGSNNDYSVSSGKQNKYFKRYLPEDVYFLYLQTFRDSNYEHFWQAIKISCQLFCEIGQGVAESLGAAYTEEYGDGFKKYVEIVKGEDGEKA